MHFKKQPCCHDMTVEEFLMADSHGDVMQDWMYKKMPTHCLWSGIFVNKRFGKSN